MDTELVRLKLRVQRSDLVVFKALLSSESGLAMFEAERTPGRSMSDVTLATTRAQCRALCLWLREVRRIVRWQRS